MFYFWDHCFVKPFNKLATNETFDIKYAPWSEGPILHVKRHNYSSKVSSLKSVHVMQECDA